MSSNAKRFGEMVRQRRRDLAMNQIEVGRAGGPSNTKLTEIEGGLLKDLTIATAKKLDKGLRWIPGSARRAWEGGEPTPSGVDVEAEIDAMNVPAETKAKMLALIDADRAARDAERGSA